LQFFHHDVLAPFALKKLSSWGAIDRVNTTRMRGVMAKLQGECDLNSFGIFFKSRRRGDRNGKLATTIVALWTLLTVLAYAEPSTADVDLALGAQYRSYPLSGVAYANIGYGLLLWGDTSSPWYGYVRPRVEASSAATYNSVDGGLEFYPVSFLGVRAGGESIQNDSDYHAYDCVKYDCQGRYYRSYINAELSLGAGPVFLQGRYRREKWSESHQGTKSFVEPTGGFALPFTGTSETIFRGILGVKLTAHWAVLAGYNSARADSLHDEISRLPFGMIRYSTERLTVGLGGGSFSSPLKEREAMVVAYLEWTIWPSLSLR
jgi:hypothetical protein